MTTLREWRAAARPPCEYRSALPERLQVDGTVRRESCLGPARCSQLNDERNAFECTPRAGLFLHRTSDALPDWDVLALLPA
jgi:hypothetical protein